jgi:hypothetical protein
LLYRQVSFKHNPKIRTYFYKIMNFATSFPTVQIKSTQKFHEVKKFETNAHQQKKQWDSHQQRATEALT